MVVLLADAVVKSLAMVVEDVHTSITLPTVFGSGENVSLANCTDLVVRLCVELFVVLLSLSL